MTKGWITAPKLFGRDSIRWSGGLLFLIILISVVAALVERRERQEYRATLSLGEMMPAYTASSVDETEVSIKEFQGSFVLLNFWATWCSTCVDQFPGMQLLLDEFEGRPLKVVSVHLDGEDRAGVQELWNRWGYGWLNLFDHPARVEAVFGWGDRYPKTILVNRDGTVGVWWRGRMDPTSPENRALIDEAMSGRAVWRPEG